MYTYILCVKDYIYYVYIIYYYKSVINCDMGVKSEVVSANKLKCVKQP